MKEKNKTYKSSLASFFASIGIQALYPLESIKTRMQVCDGASNNPIPRYRSIWGALTTIARNEGVSTLYRGVFVYLMSTSIQNIAFFTMYAFCKKKVNYEASPSNKKTMMISTISSLFTACVAHPFWTMKTRLILHMRGSRRIDKNGFVIFRRVFSDLYFNEGIFALYKGFAASFWLSSSGIINMTVYEQLQRFAGYYNKNSIHPKLKQWLPFFTGSSSRLIATTFFYPMLTIRARLQKRQYTLTELEKSSTSGKSTEGEIFYKGIIDCLTKMLKNESMRGFYKGFLPHLLRVVPSNGLFFLIYENSLKMLQHLQSLRISIIKYYDSDEVQTYCGSFLYQSRMY